MVDATESAAEEVLRTLLATPSEQTEAFEADEAVQAYLQGVVVGEARRLGLRTRSDEIGNVIVTVGPGGGPSALIFAYAMTHPANRMADPYEPRVLTDESGRRRIRGRGAAEQRGALAAALLAAAAVQEHQLRGQLVLCVSPAGETGRHDAASALIRGLAAPPDWCIVAIGTENAIGIANKGRVDATVVIRGRSAHSGQPWKGRNAIHGAVEVLQRIAAIRPAASHPQLGRATVTPTSIRSWPEATHTVQDEVRIVVDRRLLPGDDPEAALAELREATAVPDWEVEIVAGAQMYPSELPAEHPFVGLLRAVIAGEGGGEPSLLYSHGGIDAGFFNHVGVPAVMLGPGEQSQWHTEEESVGLAEVARCASVYTLAVLRHLG
jgi:acetylornithine deacetylase/succinyl-diaminopimelate desuccinylase-like protein